MLKLDWKNGSYLLVLRTHAITNWQNTKDGYPHLNTKANQQWFPRHQKHLLATTVKIDWESAIRKEFPLQVSSVQHSRGRVWCEHKRNSFVSWLRVLSLSVFLSNCQYRKQINDINRNYIKRASDNNNLWGFQTFLSVSSYLPRLFDELHSNLHERHHVRTAFKGKEEYINQEKNERTNEWMNKNLGRICNTAYYK